MNDFDENEANAVPVDLARDLYRKHRNWARVGEILKRPDGQSYNPECIRRAVVRMTNELSKKQIEAVARTLNVKLEGAEYIDDTWVNFRDTARAIIQSAGTFPDMQRMPRTGAGLRDLLFDEIEELRCGNGSPKKAMAVANLAKQIINTAQAELAFARTIQKEGRGGLNTALVSFIEVPDGPPAVSAENGVTAASCEPILDTREQEK